MKNQNTHIKNQNTHIFKIVRDLLRIVENQNTHIKNQNTHIFAICRDLLRIVDTRIHTFSRFVENHQKPEYTHFQDLLRITKNQNTHIKNQNTHIFKICRDLLRITKNQNTHIKNQNTHIFQDLSRFVENCRKPEYTHQKPEYKICRDLLRMYMARYKANFAKRTL
jgi:inhibitor of KinA sporulation pathway (predicted exonuclease)